MKNQYIANNSIICNKLFNQYKVNGNEINLNKMINLIQKFFKVKNNYKIYYNKTHRINLQWKKENYIQLSKPKNKFLINDNIQNDVLYFLNRNYQNSAIFEINNQHNDALSSSNELFINKNSFNSINQNPSPNKSKIITVNIKRICSGIDNIYKSLSLSNKCINNKRIILHDQIKLINTKHSVKMVKEKDKISRSNNSSISYNLFSNINNKINNNTKKIESIIKTVNNSKSEKKKLEKDIKIGSKISEDKKLDEKVQKKIIQKRKRKEPVTLMNLIRFEESQNLNILNYAKVLDYNDCVIIKN